MVQSIKIENFLKGLIFIGLLSLIVLIFSQQIELTSVDLGRHIANGRVVWQDYRVLFTNFYSYTEPNFPFINHHWLTGVIFYLVYLVGGFKLLSVLNIILIGSAFALAWRLARRRASFYLVATLSLPAILLLSERVEVRPEVISYLLIMLTWLIIDQVAGTKNYRRLLWLLPIFIIWVNTHIYFFIGLVLLVCKFLAEFLPPFLSSLGSKEIGWQGSWLRGYLASKVWLKALGAAILVCFMSPNHFRALLYPFNIFQNYGYEIAENKSVFFLEHLMIDYNFSLFKILLGLLILSWFLYFLLRRELALFNFLLSLFFIALSLMATRNLAIFALVWLVLISDNLSAIISGLKERLELTSQTPFRLKLFLAIVLISLIAGSFIYLWSTADSQEGFIRSPLGWGLNEATAGSAEFFRTHKLSGPIFNNYDIGSALIFWLYPQEKVFVDNRPEAYSQNFFRDIYKPMQLDPAKWQEYSAQYKIKTIYFSYTDSSPWAGQFLSYILKSPDWALVYFDRYSLILVNKNLNDAKLWKSNSLDVWAFRERLRALEVGSDLRGRFNLAVLAAAFGQADLAELIYQKIIFAWPNNRQALASLAGLYYQSADQIQLNLALDYFRRTIQAGNDLPEIYNEMGLADWRLGLYQKAEADWRSALHLDRNNISAQSYLQQLKDLRLQGKIN